MRLLRRKRTHGEFGRPLIELDWILPYGEEPAMPVAYPVDGATEKDCEYIREWLGTARLNHDEALMYVRTDILRFTLPAARRMKRGAE